MLWLPGKLKLLLCLNMAEISSGQPSPGCGGEVLSLLYPNTSSIISVSSSGGPLDPVDPLLNHFCGLKP